MKKGIFIWLLAAGLASCTGGEKDETAEEEEHDSLSRELLQGVWLDDYTEQPVLKICGDSIYTSGRFDIPLHFRIEGDTLIAGGTERITYYIHQLEKNSFQFYTSIGDLITLHKAETDTIPFGYEAAEPVREVIEKDSVFMFQGKRFRGYAYINPSTKKVIRPGITEEGLIVDKVYFDNVIHICVYQGKQRLYSKDLHKEMFAGTIPDDFLKMSILSDMDFMGVSSKGYHYRATICMPDGMTCYYVDLLIDKDDQIHYTLKQ